MQTPILRTPRLQLRVPVLEDSAKLCEYYRRNREALQPWSPTFSEDLFEYAAWPSRIRWIQDEYANHASVRFVLFDSANLPIGVANFVNFQGFPAHSCILGYGLDAEQRGKGYMHEALEVAIPYIFREHGVHRIEANYMPRNEKSAAVLRRLGFSVDGYSRDYLLINGAWEDHIRTSLINPNWPA